MVHWAAAAAAARAMTTRWMTIIDKNGGKSAAILVSGKLPG
jgi:hypothetical protein